MSNDPKSPSSGLEDLDARIKAARPKLDDAAILRAKSSANDAASQALTVAFAFVLCIAVGAGVGLWIDRFLGTPPWFMIIGFFAGFGLGFWYMLFKARQFDERQRERGTDDG